EMKENDINYIAKELGIFKAELDKYEHAPLKERKKGAKEFLEMLTSSPDDLIGAARLLIDGSYGKGAMLAFKRLSKRCNRVAWLFITIGIIEYGTDERRARQTWWKLTDDQRLGINAKLA